MIGWRHDNLITPQTLRDRDAAEQAAEDRRVRALLYPRLGNVVPVPRVKDDERLTG